MVDNNDLTLRRIDGLYLQDVASKGRGLFCSAPIQSDTVIEVCPTIVFDEADAGHIDKTNLYNYYFSTSFIADDAAADFRITKKDSAGLIALGLLSLCNHSEQPNADVKKIIQEKQIYFLLRAMRDLAANEEITIAYGKVWFNAV